MKEANQQTRAKPPVGGVNLFQSVAEALRRKKEQDEKRRRQRLDQGAQNTVADNSQLEEKSREKGKQTSQPSSDVTSTQPNVVMEASNFQPERNGGMGEKGVGATKRPSLITQQPGKQPGAKGRVRRHNGSPFDASLLGGTDTFTGWGGTLISGELVDTEHTTFSEIRDKHEMRNVVGPQTDSSRRRQEGPSISITCCAINCCCSSSSAKATGPRSSDPLAADGEDASGSLYYDMNEGEFHRSNKSFTQDPISGHLFNDNVSNHQHRDGAEKKPRRFCCC